MSKQLEDTRIKILKCIEENQPISARDISAKTGTNLRSVHYHIRRMKVYVNREVIGKYSLTDHGEELLNEIRKGEHIEWILGPGNVPKEASGLMLLEIDDSSVLDPNQLSEKFGAYRTPYEIIASMLFLGKKGFTVGEAVHKTGVSFSRLKNFIRIVEEKRLIVNIGAPSGRVGKFWKTTEKGLVFLYLHSQIQGLLK